MEGGRKNFKVPSLEEMEEADEQMCKEKLTPHFKNNMPQTVKDPVVTENPAKSTEIMHVSSDPFAAIKKFSTYQQVRDEFRTMVEEAKTAPADSGEPIVKPITNISSKNLIVNARQRGNPLLKGITSVAWEFGDIIPDYVMGRTTCALFLSIRYHSLNPNYILDRIKQLGNNYELRVLLVQIDVKDPHHSLNQLMKIAITTNMTIILAWSPEEAGRHLETYKMFQHKPPDLLMKKQDVGNYSKVIDALTSVKSINRSDAVVLLDQFKNLEGILSASIEQLSFCPGFGVHKASKLHSVLHENFLKTTTK